mmetsp:Transcript_1391/g.5066  ORF Transcript_1391/g.5066 Transcript_1391/m.5066 type:complete len:252 (+) Transcript_1391:5247-6002(+)
MSSSRVSNSPMVELCKYSSNATVTLLISSRFTLSSSETTTSSSPRNTLDFIEFSKRWIANQVRLAREAWRSLQRASNLGQVRSSRARHRSASLAHSPSSALSDVCAAADSSQICARAKSSSIPVRPDFTGPSSGNANIRSQISASCVSRGCSGHSSKSSVIRRRAAATGGTIKAISPGHPPTVSSASSASAAASSSSSALLFFLFAFIASSSSGVAWDSYGDVPSASMESAGRDTADCSKAARSEWPNRAA